jgi:hypothetical protein
MGGSVVRHNVSYWFGTKWMGCHDLIYIPHVALRPVCYKRPSEERYS